MLRQKEGHDSIYLHRDICHDATLRLTGCGTRNVAVLSNRTLMSWKYSIAQHHVNKATFQSGSVSFCQDPRLAEKKKIHNN
jgi:hypothetical protein